MARLTIEQVAAPNMSAAGNMLAQAGASFDRGISAAGGLLEKYQEGQQSKGDAALLGEIAGIQDEAGLADFLSTADLANANLSDDMRAHVLGLRDNVIGYAQGRADVDQTRANTALTGANTRRTNVSTDLALAGESRTAADWAYGNQRRDELAALTPAYANAVASGQQNGYNVPQGEVQTQVYDGLLARGIPEHVAQGFMMNFQDESGFNVDITEAEANVHGTFGKGLYQLTGARRDAFEAKYGNDYSIDNQLDFMMEELGGSESAAAQAIFNTSNAGEAGAAIVRNFLRPAQEHQDSRSAAYLRSGSAPITSNGAQSPAAAALMQAVASNSTMTIEDVNAIVNGVNAAQDRGQAQIDTAEAARVADAQAGSILAGIQSPDVTSTAGLANSIINDSNLTPTQQLAAVSASEQAAAGPLGGILAPQVEADPLLQAQADSDARTRQREIDALPQTRLLNTAERYGDDPTNGLIEDLGLGSDGEDPRTYVFGLFGENVDDNQLRRHINTIAESAGVTPAMAAAAMADEFKRDPWGTNRRDKRFNPDDVVAYLNETVGPEGMRAYEGALVQQQTRDARSQSIQLQISAAQTQLAKATDPARRQQLQNQVNQLKDQSLNGITPQEAQQKLRTYMQGNGMAARLRQIGDPDSADYFRAIEDMRTEIERDQTLTDREKSLLISTMTG